jgi:hypothetical protein
VGIAGSASVGEIDLRLSAPYSGEVSPLIGTSTNFGSPMNASRSANASLRASVIRWMYSTELCSSDLKSSGLRMCSVSASSGFWHHGPHDLTSYDLKPLVTGGSTSTWERARSSRSSRPPSLLTNQAISSAMAPR